VLVVIAACKHAPPPPAVTPAVTEQDAKAAYDHKEYATCGPKYEQLAGHAKSGAGDLYNAACCRALAGDTGAAFADLDRAIAAGFVDRGQLERDDDLLSLRGDPRWAQTLVTLDRAQQAFEMSLREPALRRELLALVDQDQQARNAWIQAGPTNEAAAERVRAIDTKSTARLKEVVAKLGWPGKTLVGKDGANAAWLLIQHADADPDFQKQCLALIERAVAAGEVSEIDYAYLYDRVAVAEHRPQRYGTQFANGEPLQIEDAAHVDERRTALGLPTMAEYAEEMRRMYGSAAVKPRDGGS
jgi:hypothetical protein